MARPLNATSREYATIGRSQLRSLLSVQDSSSVQRLWAPTRFDDGGWVSEEATLDDSGRLIRAQMVLSRPGEVESGTVLDAARGVAEVADATGARRWSVRNELPWTWTVQLGGRDSATPLTALVALRGAATSEAMRQIDLGAGDLARLRVDVARANLDECGRQMRLAGLDLFVPVFGFHEDCFEGEICNYHVWNGQRWKKFPDWNQLATELGPVQSPAEALGRVATMGAAHERQARQPAVAARWPSSILPLH